MTTPSPREVADWAAAMQRDLETLLATRERSTYRVLTLTESFAALADLSIKQEALMRESLRCIEYGLYRPAHVSSWAALVDFCHDWCTDDQRLSIMQATRPAWKIARAADLRQQTDFALFDAMHAGGLITKTSSKALQGLLNKRNECAHPEDFEPGVNETLGYVNELMKRIATLQFA